MIVNSVTEMTIMEILDRGVPNKECIGIRINQRVNLGQYGIMLGRYAHSKMAIPIQDHLFWFGDGLVDEGDWIFIGTGEGTPKISATLDQLRKIYTVFWNKPNTVFANTNIVPLLFRIDAVDVLEPVEDKPQTKRLTG